MERFRTVSLYRLAKHLLPCILQITQYPTVF